MSLNSINETFPLCWSEALSALGMVFQQRFRPCVYLVAQLYGLVMSFLDAFFKVLLSSSSSWLLSAMVNERRGLQCQNPQS